MAPKLCVPPFIFHSLSGSITVLHKIFLIEPLTFLTLMFLEEFFSSKSILSYRLINDSL